MRRAAKINAENRAWLKQMSQEARAAKQRLATEYLVRLHLPNAIENYRRAFRRVPPMSVKELNITSRFQQLRIEKNALNKMRVAFEA